MDDNQEPPACATPQQNEALLSLRMLRIVHQKGVLIDEGGFGLSEGDPVFAAIRRRLAGIPLEPERTHV
jgi:hypothetical protein